ncbi:MAG: lipopolysaccharide biosynthesis protein [Bacteroidales bacterium]|nr:lipopolysaccharide biosynthesis protein [Bacteroidales bacterium]
MSGLKQKSINGLIWSAVERFAVQGVQFLVMLIMARLLTPDDYGLLGMAAVFIALSYSLVDSGFSQALIRKQNRTEVDNSTVFYFNIVVGVIVYIVCFSIATLIADFYEKEELSPIIRSLCLVTIINSFAVVQRAQLTILIDFKSQAKASLISAIISGCIGIYLAYSGYGVWSLVWQQLIAAIINTSVLWLYSKWRPNLLFSWVSFRELFSFGSKLMISGLLDTIYKEIYPIIIGKLFNASSLGHYTRAKHFSEFPSSNLTGIIQRVTYPVLCEIQDEENRLREVYRRFLKMSAYVIFPLMICLSAVSIPFIKVAIGDQWLFCAKLLQIICFAMMWYPIHAINLNLLQVKGRSDLFLKLEIVKKIISIIVIVFTVPYGLVVMCYGQIVNSLIALIINTHYTGKLIGLGFMNQVKDLLPTIVLSMVMFVFVIYLQELIVSDIMKLLVGGGSGVLFFLGISILFGFKEIEDISSVLLKKK